MRKLNRSFAGRTSGSLPVAQRGFVAGDFLRSEPPSCHLRWNAGNNRIAWHGLYYHRARAHDGAPSDRDAGQNDCAVADPNIILNHAFSRIAAR